MAEFLEVRSAFKRMCDYYGCLPECAGCPVLESKSSCGNFLLKEPRAEEIIMHWDKTHIHHDRLKAHSYWIIHKEEDRTYGECPICGITQSVGELNFCPHCGTYMWDDRYGKSN